MDRNEFLILDIPAHYLPKYTESMFSELDQQWGAIRFLLLEEMNGYQTSSSSLHDLTRYVSRKLAISVSPSIDYIHTHYKSPIKLEDLAAIEHYHPVYYSSWFKRKMGKSLREYISELRLQEAKQLLISTNWSIINISQEIGFENASSFTRWFLKCEGVSPQQFRKLHFR
jgi:YesN/AraC family two-component response regulator